MDKMIDKIFFTLNKLIDAELTCLFEVNKSKIGLINYSATEDVFNLLNNNDFSQINDLSALQKLLSDRYKFGSYIEDYFLLDQKQYYIYSGSKNSNSLDNTKAAIHSGISKIVQEIIISSQSLQNNILSNKDELQLFADSSSDLIFNLDETGVFTYINNPGIEQLKYSSEEIIGKHIFELVKDNYKTDIGNAFQQIISENKKVEIYLELIPRVSVEQQFTINLIPIYSNGKIVKLLGIGKNISKQNAEKKKNDDLLSKLKEANRINAIERDRAKQQISILNELNSLKNEFISNVSHELRTPLASIIGFSETIIEDKNLTIERAKEFNEIILNESKRLAKLINDVIDFSDLENEKQHLEKTSINIIEVMNNCLLQIKEECTEKKITLTNKLPESEIIIFADEGRLSKAFNYLLSNAVKFTNENGRITVMAQEFLNEVELIISDTGIGISEQKLPFLFDKFSKVRRAGNNLPGAGFGLVTVKQIIDLHKGLIRVKSEVDKGTSFIIRLPKYSFN